MNRLIGRTGMTLALAALVAGSAIAAPPKGKKAAAAECPVCHMALKSKKSDDNPVAVKMSGKTLYCCSKCKMPASVLVKTGGKKPAAKKGGKM